MTVLASKILVEEPSTEKKSAGGIVIASEKIDYSKPLEAKVIEVGKKVEEVKKGDTVMYLPNAGTSIKKEDGSWRVLEEEEIIAIV